MKEAALLLPRRGIFCHRSVFGTFALPLIRGSHASLGNSGESWAQLPLSSASRRLQLQLRGGRRADSQTSSHLKGQKPRRQAGTFATGGGDRFHSLDFFYTQPVQ